MRINIVKSNGGNQEMETKSTGIIKGIKKTSRKLGYKENLDGIGIHSLDDRSTDKRMKMTIETMI